jgi:hypothetical protein
MPFFPFDNRTNIEHRAITKRTNRRSAMTDFAQDILSFLSVTMFVATVAVYLGAV